MNPYAIPEKELAEMITKLPDGKADVGKRFLSALYAEGGQHAVISFISRAMLSYRASPYVDVSTMQLSDLSVLELAVLKSFPVPKQTRREFMKDMGWVAASAALVTHGGKNLGERFVDHVTPPRPRKPLEPMPEEITKWGTAAHGAEMVAGIVIMNNLHDTPFEQQLELAARAAAHLDWELQRTLHERKGR